MKEHALRKREKLFKATLRLLGSCANTRLPSLLDAQLEGVRSFFNDRIRGIRLTVENHEYDIQKRANQERKQMIETSNAL